MSARRLRVAPSAVGPAIAAALIVSAATCPAPTISQTGTGGPLPPTKPSPVTLTPSSFSLTSAEEQEEREAVLTWQGEPSESAEPLALEAPDDLPSGLRLETIRVGPLIVERDRSGKATGTLRQRVRLRFSSIPRRLEALSVPLVAKLGLGERTVEISASNAAGPPNGASLVMVSPAQLSWTPGKPIGVVVKAVGSAASGISFAAGPFVDLRTDRPAPINLCLSTATDGPCAEAISIDLNSHRDLFLQDEGGSSIPAGQYTGSLRLLAGNGLETEQTIVLHVSSAGWRWAGLLALLVGTIVSFLLTVLLPYRRDRELAMRPFAALRARLEEAAARRRGHATPEIDALSARIGEPLEDQWLVERGYLGPAWPSPYWSPPDSTLLKAHLDAQTPWVAAVESLTSNVIEHADKASAVDAVAAESGLQPDNVEVRIQTALGKDVQRSLRPAGSSMTLAEIMVREDARSAIVWLLSSLLAVGLGYVILIEGNPSFGGWTDVFGALLWALGLSVTGGKIAEVTSGQLRTMLKPTKTA